MALAVGGEFHLDEGIGVGVATATGKRNIEDFAIVEVKQIAQPCLLGDRHFRGGGDLAGDGGAKNQIGSGGTDAAEGDNQFAVGFVDLELAAHHGGLVATGNGEAQLLPSGELNLAGPCGEEAAAGVIIYRTKGTDHRGIQAGDRCRAIGAKECTEAIDAIEKKCGLAIRQLLRIKGGEINKNGASALAAEDDS